MRQWFTAEKIQIPETIAWQVIAGIFDLLNICLVFKYGKDGINYPEKFLPQPQARVTLFLIPKLPVDLVVITTFNHTYLEKLNIKAAAKRSSWLAMTIYLQLRCNGTDRR